MKTNNEKKCWQCEVAGFPADIYVFCEEAEACMACSESGGDGNYQLASDSKCQTKNVSQE